MLLVWNAQHRQHAKRVLYCLSLSWCSPRGEWGAWSATSQRGPGRTPSSYRSWRRRCCTASTRTSSCPSSPSLTATRAPSVWRDSTASVWSQHIQGLLCSLLLEQLFIFFLRKGDRRLPGEHHKGISPQTAVPQSTGDQEKVRQTGNPLLGGIEGLIQT